MLYILLHESPSFRSDVKTPFAKELIWHVETKVKVNLTLESFLDRTFQVQADGHELEWIRERFVNLPDEPQGRVVSWFGDHAKMIAYRIAMNYLQFKDE